MNDRHDADADRRGNDEVHRQTRPTEAPSYTHGHHPSVLRSHSWRTARNSAAYLIPRLRPGVDLLDVGCGPGTITLDLAQMVAPGRVVGVDSATAAIESARATSRARGRADHDNVEFERADAYGLPFAAEFDVVHAHQVLQHLDDPVRALREWQRVCRPGGTVAVCDADYAAMAWWPQPPLLERWSALYHQAARANGGEPDAGRRLLGWALRAGFARPDIEVSTSTWCWATPEDRRHWAGTWAERIATSAIAEQLCASGASSQPELDAIADAWHDWARHDDGWFVVVNTELLCSVRTGR